MENELSIEVSENGVVSISGKTIAKNFKSQMKKLEELGMKKLNATNTEPKFSDIVFETHESDGWFKVVAIDELKEFIKTRISLSKVKEQEFAQLKIIHDILCYGEVKE